jgi:hypothetical protein
MKARSILDPCRSCFTRLEADGVDRRRAGVEEPEVPLRGIPRLLVLVEHGEDVRLQRAASPRRALADVVDQPLVVVPRVVHAGAEPAGRRPPALGDDHLHVGRAGLLQRGVDGVHHGVEEVRVGQPVVAHGRRAGLERRVPELDVARVALVREVGVHVDEQRRARAGQEPRDVRRVRLRERALGRRGRVGERVVPQRRGHLDAAEPRRVQRGAEVAHGGEDSALRAAALHLVAHGDVLDVHRPVVGLHVGLDPRRRCGRVGRELPDHVVAGVEDEADARVAQGVQRRLVGWAVDAHPVDALGPVQLHHLPRRREVVAKHAIAHADGLHRCTQLDY